MKTYPNIKELEKMGPVLFDSAEAWRVAIPMHEPFRISSGEVTDKDTVLVRLSDGQHFGWGESSAMPGAFYSSETPDSCAREMVESLLPQFVGRSYPTMLHLEKALAEHSSSRFVRVAIETAAWELLARQRNQSLRDLFRLPARAVPTGLAVGLYDTQEELRSALERYRPEAYRRLKIKIKRGYDLDLVRSVREWYGKTPLFVDANGDYSRADLDLFRELDRFGLMMFEQPFAREDMETSAELQAMTQTPVCLDESIETVNDAEKAARLRACSIVNIKLQRVGGYLEAFRIAECCARNGITLWTGTMPELGVGSAQALVFAQHPGCTYPTDREPSDRWYQDDVVDPPLAPTGDTFLPTDAIGLGYEVLADKLGRYATDYWSFPS